MYRSLVTLFQKEMQINYCCHCHLRRDNAKRLVYENDMLQMQMSNTERDTLDVITYLKQEDGKKDEQVPVRHYKMSL